ncbi:MAG TPA: 50S ribosomal protein L11 methyltransferase [Candidatus Limnocylindria bacterium]
MRWLELTVEADAEAVEAVSEILGRLGQGAAVRPTRLLRDPDDELSVREDSAAPYELTAHLPDDPAAPAAIDATERALWHLQAFGLRPVGTLRVRSVDERDWTEGWKAGYEPQRIGRLLIVPSWLEPRPAQDEVVLRLDPGMAFGTGLHPTTRGCLALLQDIEPMPSRVLDVGSGSGILGIAALALGAGQVDALDTDPVAVEATRANAGRNGVAERVTASAGTVPARCDQPYPLVLANLVASVLVELAGRLASHTDAGGALLASGIIAERGDEVVSALETAGFTVAQRLDDGEWISLRMRRA